MKEPTNDWVNDGSTSLPFLSPRRTGIIPLKLLPKPPKLKSQKSRGLHKARFRGSIFTSSYFNNLSTAHASVSSLLDNIQVRVPPVFKPFLSHISRIRVDCVRDFRTLSSGDCSSPFTSRPTEHVLATSGIRKACSFSCLLHSSSVIAVYHRF